MKLYEKVLINNRFIFMKFLSRNRILLGFFIIAWIIGMIFLLVSKNSYRSQIKVQRMSLHPLLHPLQHNRLPPPTSFKMVKMIRYCNPPDDIEAHHEGKPPINGTLEFVAAVIRHGDRAPLRPIRNQSLINCSTVKTPMVLRYLQSLQYMRGYAKHLSPFISFPLHPSEKQCFSAQLTLLGAHQHLKLGQMLHKVYIDEHKLLKNNWTSKDFKLFSTVYSRTFQSALAFLFTFLPNFNISNIQIAPSSTTKFCMIDYYCNCPLDRQFTEMINLKSRRLLQSHPAVLQLLQRLNPIVKSHPNHSDILHPVEMFDSLSGYVCHGSYLPCTPGSNNCVTFEHVRNVLAYLDWEGRQFIRDSVNKKASLLKMMGFFSHLINSIKDSISGKSPARFMLYSGHDVTLQPLAVALGVHDGNLIPYASRMIFEVYSYAEDGNLKYLIKVIFNGKDVTKYTFFCKPFFEESLKKSAQYGLCPLESFRTFIELNNAMKGTSFQEACSVTELPYQVTYGSYSEDLGKL